jgi:hypothetical protein
LLEVQFEVAEAEILPAVQAHPQAVKIYTVPALLLRQL